MNKTVKTPTVLLETRSAYCDACSAVRSVEVMDLHLEMNVGEGQHTETTGFTIKVNRFSQPATNPIPHDAWIVSGGR